MAKFQSPLLGYNNNVRHKGRIFHIQTEDSGVNHPHVITHLFMDGGRILKSVKRSYAEHVGSDGLTETVRSLMKEQHKAMFIALRDGQFDALVDGATTPVRAAPPPAAAAAPAPPAPQSNETSSAVMAALQATAPAKPPEPRPESRPRMNAAPPPPPVAASPRSEVPATVDESRHVAAVASSRRGTASSLLVVTEDDVDDEPHTTREPDGPKRHPSSQELTLDFDALDRPQQDMSLFNASELPPAPRNMFGVPKERSPTAYRAATRPPDVPARPSARPAAPSTSREGRYAPARPAAIFGAAAKQASASIFSDDLVSDKSLDEVILSYLAEDLEPPRRK